MSDGYNHAQARTPEQARQMKDLAARKVCAFCPENILTETRTPIDMETDHWFVKENDYPYKDTKLHLLLIPKEHAKSVADLSAKAQTDFIDVVVQVEKHYNLTSYAVAMRSGDPRYNGGSVEHLHAHIIVGDKTSAEPVRFKVYSPPKAT